MFRAVPDKEAEGLSTKNTIIDSIPHSIVPHVLKSLHQPTERKISYRTTEPSLSGSEVVKVSSKVLTQVVFSLPSPSAPLSESHPRSSAALMMSGAQAASTG